MNPQYLANLAASMISKDIINPTIILATKDNANTAAKFLQNKGMDGIVFVVETDERDNIVVETSSVKRNGKLTNVEGIRLESKKTGENIYSVSAYTKSEEGNLTEEELQEEIANNYINPTMVNLTDVAMNDRTEEIMADRLKNAVVSDEYHNGCELIVDCSNESNINFDYYKKMGATIILTKDQIADNETTLKEKGISYTKKANSVDELNNRGILEVDNVTERDIKTLYENAIESKTFEDSQVIVKIKGEVSSNILKEANEKNIIFALTTEQFNLLEKDITENNIDFILVTDENTVKENLNNALKTGLAVGVLTNKDNIETLRDILKGIVNKTFVGIKDALQSISKTIAKTPEQQYRGQYEAIMKSAQNYRNDINFETLSYQLQNKGTIYKLLTTQSNEWEKEDELKTAIKDVVNSEIFTKNEGAKKYVVDLLESGKVFQAQGALRGFVQLAMQEKVFDYLANGKDENDVREKLSGRYGDLRDYLTIEMIKLAMQGEDINKLFERTYDSSITLSELERIVKENELEILKQNRYKIDISTPATLENTGNILDILDSQLPEAKITGESIGVTATNITRSFLADA